MKTPARFLLFLCILSRVTVPLSAEDSPGTTRTDLKRSMELAGQNLIRMLHPGRDYLPSFLIAVDPESNRRRSSTRIRKPSSEGRTVMPPEEL